MELNRKNFNILYVDDEENNLISFRAALRRHFTIFTALSGEEGMEIVKQNDIHVIVTDQRMPGMTGVQFLQRLPDEPDSIRMILTGFSDIEAIIEAINTGRVYRYITKPWDKDELKITIDNALEAVNLRRHNKHLIKELKDHNDKLEETVAQRTLEIEKKSLQLQSEIEKSDKLLLNILPEEIAGELKRFGKSYARKYEQVSVLFSDIKGFTTIAEVMEPDELIAQLDDSFRGFDRIIEKYGIEKIKTIGDSYMCVSGLPTPVENHAQVLIKVALDMQEFMRGFNTTKRIQNLPEFQIRIGVHTGPVVAGVVGSKKFAYDIWGDTVNLASQMEQRGIPGKINISGNTYERVKNSFKCTHRGKIPAKSKGEIDMYFVEAKL
ncbi:adenylate/guanylate cyclase domain-containing protein [Pricia sp. S334]|uniref:Adenylate/guanylate cyclase domain-containing protein n=1 Tax=Pricia mediterranea TaxID=3076079 RepID=A0ABU3L0U0_9FLAO|nr:adenylate/guanylate cyclase domain-containing protein [Pricia sp. S334]MDT7827335.1 adenylate/guanylate cyclase domain-containing protein [Pricia sp. S334]